MPSSDSAPGLPGGRAQGSAWLAVRVLVVRFRSLFLLAGVLLLVGSWPALRAWWARANRPEDAPRGQISLNMEYWCPMCPGVVSDVPDKCPVCHMALLRREKGEPVPLPDGVVARMQFSPYRVQLAGIRTALADYRPLRREVVLVGTVARDSQGRVAVDAEVFEKELPFLTEGRPVEAASDLLPGHLPFRGEVAGVEAVSSPGGRSFRVRLRIEDPGRDLRAGTLVTARVETSVLRLAWWRRAAGEEMRDRAAVELAVRSLLAPAGPLFPGGAESLVRRAVAEAQDAGGMGLAIPHSAVLDHGSRKVAFVESGAGMFDAVEVIVGPRCGDFYPVLRGVAAGQRVVVANAFLLDAEMWLNHSLAAGYFGASRGAGSGAEHRAHPQGPMPAPGTLTPEDRVLAARQKVCPVSDEPLDSMGGPVRVEVAGRTVFICCKSCEGLLRKEPEKYLPKLPPR